MKTPTIISILRWTLPLTLGLAAFAQNATRVEVFTGTKTRSVTIYHSPPGTPDPNSDADHNGLPDTWEQDHFGQAGVDPEGDADRDGLSNRRELQYGSDPHAADSDHDGVSDGQEAADGSDPNDASSGRYADVLWQTSYTVSGRNPVVTTPGPGVPDYTYTQSYDNGRRYRKITVKITTTGHPRDQNGTYILTATYDPASQVWQIAEDDPLRPLGVPNWTMSTEDLSSWYYYPPNTSRFYQDNRLDASISPILISWHTEATLDYYGADNYGAPIGTTFYTYDEEYTLSELAEPVTTGGNPVSETYSTTELPQASRSGSTEKSAHYHLEVPATMTGTLRWLEIFTPAGNPDGRQFTAHSWTINGTTSPEFTLTAPADGESTVQFFSAELAVDANRDGQIKFASDDASDATTPERPYRFWLNNDGDVTITSPLWVDSDPETLGDPVTLAVSTPDNSDDRIQSPRDLEDFARLWLNTSGLAPALRDGSLKLSLFWTPDSTRFQESAPIIRLFLSVEADGNWNYIRSTLVAGQQTTGEAANAIKDDSSQSIVGPPSEGAAANGFTFPKSFWQSDSDRRYLLFEGVAKGTGRLSIELQDKEGLVVYLEHTGLWIQLRDVEQLYARAHATPDRFHFPLPYKQGDPPDPPYTYEASQLLVPTGALGFAPGYDEQDPVYAFEKAPDEENKCIVYVHGVDMDIPALKSYTASFYKRLWWAGYRGRLSVFRWATPISGELATWANGLTIFNDGEFRSWTNGWCLKEYVASLTKPDQMPGATISIAGHSLGNACVGSALHQGMVIDNYVMMEAAVALSCYFPISEDPANDQLSSSRLSRLADAEAAQHTPDFFTDQGYRGFLSNIASNIRNQWWNYSNPTDFWLQTGFTTAFPVSGGFGSTIVGPVEVNWVKNQAELKIEDLHALSFASSYSYDGSIGPGFNCFFSSATLARSVADTHEALAYIARSRVPAVGAELGTRNGQPPRARGARDLRAYGFDRLRGDHSGQFQRNVQLLYSTSSGTPYPIPFYYQLLEDLAVAPNAFPR